MARLEPWPWLGRGLRFRRSGVGKSCPFHRSPASSRPAFIDVSSRDGSRGTRKLPGGPACHRNSYRYLPISPARWTTGSATAQSTISHFTTTIALALQGPLRRFGRLHGLIDRFRMRYPGFCGGRDNFPEADVAFFGLHFYGSGVSWPSKPAVPDCWFWSALACLTRVIFATHRKPPQLSALRSGSPPKGPPSDHFCAAQVGFSQMRIFDRCLPALL